MLCVNFACWFDCFCSSEGAEFQVGQPRAKQASHVCQNRSPGKKRHKREDTLWESQKLEGDLWISAGCGFGGVESLPPRALNGTEALRRNWVAYEIKNSLSKGSTGSHTSFGLLGNPYIASVKKYLLIEIFGFTYKKTKTILTSQHLHKHFLKVFYH